MNRTARTGTRSLDLAAVIFTLCFVAHNADHARRGAFESPEAVVWAGTGIAMLSAVLVTLVVVRHHLAARACAVGGMAIAVGASFTHLLPKWGPLSDPVLVQSLDGWSRGAVLLEIHGALWLGLVGFRAVRFQVRAADRSVLGVQN